MRTAIYIRVSTKRQEKKFSLEGQRDDLTKYANDQGWEIVTLLQDVESGAKLEKKGLSQLLEIVEEGLIDVVLVADQDRLSRLDTIAWEYLKGVLKENNVKLAQPGRMTNLDNEDDEFMSDLHNLLAQNQRRKLVRAMMRGKRRRMREGRGFGKPPFGYLFDKTSGEYVIDDKWAWTIPLMDRLYLDEQLGMVSIANRMNEIGPSPSGRPWNETLIHRRLVSKAFHGVMEKTFSNGETIAIPDLFPPLRTKETYGRLQEERKRRGTTYKVTSRERDDLHIFRRTYFECKDCGRKLNLTQHGTSEKPRYYLKHGRKKLISSQDSCTVAINTVKIEDEAIRRLKDIVRSPELAQRYFELGTASGETASIKKELNSIEIRLNTVKLKLDRLLDLYLEGDFSKEQLEKRKEKLEEEKLKMESEIEGLKRKLILLDKDTWSHELIESLQDIAEDIEKELTPKELAILFGRIFPEAKVGKNHIDFLTYIKGAPFSTKLSFDPAPLARGGYKGSS